MKQYLTTLILGMLLIMTGCSSDIEVLDEHQPDEKTSRVYELISDYYKSKNPSTKSVAQAFRITGISTQTYTVENEKVRSSEISDSDSTFQMQTVTLDFGATTGYAIVSDDPRIEEVYFLTENGLPSDTSFIKPLKDLFELYPEMAKESLLSENKTRADYHNGSNLIQNVTPFMWGQDAPYNYCAPYCTCSLCSTNRRDNHQLAGCVTTAVAQYLATRGYFNGTYYPNGNIDFSTFQTRYSKSSSSGESGKIANFFREVAHNCQIKFGCEASNGQIEPVLNYLQELGIDCKMMSGTVDKDGIFTQLSKGIPVIACGIDPDKEIGHMWLVTGVDYNYIEYFNTITLADYYCNWGWDGISDGWSRFNMHTAYNNLDGSVLANYKNNLRYILTTSW